MRLVFFIGITHSHCMLKSSHGRTVSRCRMVSNVILHSYGGNWFSSYKKCGVFLYQSFMTHCKHMQYFPVFSDFIPRGICAQSSHWSLTHERVVCTTFKTICEHDILAYATFPLHNIVQQLHSKPKQIPTDAISSSLGKMNGAIASLLQTHIQPHIHLVNTSINNVMQVLCFLIMTFSKKLYPFEHLQDCGQLYCWIWPLPSLSLAVDNIIGKLDLQHWENWESYQRHRRTLCQIGVLKNVYEPP